MSSKNTTELKGMSVEQLQSQAAELESGISKMKFDHAVRGLQNPMELRKTRKEIARLYTEIRDRELAQASEPELAKRSKLRLRRRSK
ncbi:MAG: 50S ribosomal protein L29 [Saprospiraceae bacterium]|nr:50S ribosomal protein L29 [Saprospiraceae bacterium]MBK7223296.1 50S ribosomal protein L29 [Saprospiraceae bacterium]MBK7790154.1 50S ribosomal protein L29 [Saprospiraceae bacterium]MBK8110027.1 50S ribosomal protein L29 [Saprospiraceae bacterium]MBK9689987.1 50S ribosomal protein L29 [Saprospiraceae bacterium]